MRTLGGALVLPFGGAKRETEADPPRLRQAGHAQNKPRLCIRLCNEGEKDKKAGSARTFFTAGVASLH
ncbi:MAG: hypothetical protein CFE24_12235 [Flavobacterium sp. BFFFF2]|nr:MAG: hypothetical protein CFE24_12235 [Flavobacterium sp. BFFFF2]